MNFSIKCLVKIPFYFYILFNVVYFVQSSPDLECINELSNAFDNKKSAIDNVKFLVGCNYKEPTSPSYYMATTSPYDNMELTSPNDNMEPTSSYDNMEPTSSYDNMEPTSSYDETDLLNCEKRNELFTSNFEYVKEYILHLMNNFNFDKISRFGILRYVCQQLVPEKEIIYCQAEVAHIFHIEMNAPKSKIKNVLFAEYDFKVLTKKDNKYTYEFILYFVNNIVHVCMGGDVYGIDDWCSRKRKKKTKIEGDYKQGTKKPKLKNIVY